LAHAGDDALIHNEKETSTENHGLEATIHDLEPELKLPPTTDQPVGFDDRGIDAAGLQIDQADQVAT
jgi:hypothetical protein